MVLSSKSRIVVGIAPTLIVVLVFIWLIQFNRYHVLYYQEQMQLFRFNLFYFHSYWIKPGGIAEYVGAFLTQFYFYPLIGATFLSLLLAGIYLLFDSICRRDGKTECVLVFLFIPVFLFIMFVVNQYFRISYLIGFMICLAGFRVYITFKKPLRCFFGFVVFLFVYIVAAGNAILFVVLVWIFELFSWKQKHPYLLIYLVALTTWSVIIPFLAYRLVYTVTPREAFFALTPVDFFNRTFVNVSAWLSIPVLYVCWRWLATRIQAWKLTVWKVLASLILVVVLGIGCMFYVTERKVEVIIGMAFNVQNSHWNKAIQLGSSYPFSNNLISYFTNISVAESGLLPYRMFYYYQAGATGLFLRWQQSFFTIPYIGEAYYRLGMIQEAEHCAFEAMVGASDEHNSQSIRRLVTTSVIMRDTILFNKYIQLFDHTLFYRKWANQQRKQMIAALADSTYIVPGAPQLAQCDNFFHNMYYDKPDFILNKLLEKNPDHRLAFEYLMAWYMLNKDIDSVIECMDTYFHRFSYPNLPVHYEEALIIYQNAHPTSNIVEQYQVSGQTRERYNNYLQAYKLVQSNSQIMKMLYQQYGNSYWFYLHFNQPELLLQSEDETNRY